MKALVVALLCLVCWQATGQISVSTSDHGGLPYSRATRVEFMHQLKHSTALFVLQGKDYDNQARFDSIIKSTWTVCPYKIIKPEDLTAYQGKEGYTIFSFGVYYTGKHHTTQHLTYDLWYPVFNKKGKLKDQFIFSRTLLYPEKYVSNVGKNYTYTRQKYDLAPMKYVINDIYFYNWDATFFKGYLQTINALLTDNKSRNVSDEYKDATLATLKTDTLYIPEYIKVRPYVWSNASYIDTTLTESWVAESYPYPFRFVTDGELDALLAGNNRELHYMVYTLDAAEKYIDIFSSKKGLIYSCYREMSWNFKQKDMARLARAVAL